MLVLGALVLVAACGDDGTEAAGGRPTVVVTTSILGDVVEHLVGDLVDVDTVMPRGADPHAFQPSARQVARIRKADALVVNGGGFEAGLDDVVSAAAGDGVATFFAIDAVEPLIDDGHTADDGHDHGDADPHFFTDPARMLQAAEAIVEFLAGEAVDRSALERAAAPYLEELAALDAEVEDDLSSIPDEDRVLVTTHAVFGPFADRYRFEVVGTVIPGGSTADGASAGALAELAGRIDELGVPAVFTDASSESGLVRALVDEVGDVEVVELFTESLGAEGSDGATYVQLMRANARRIAAALGPGAP